MKTKQCSAMTLIELMIAIVVLSVGCLGLAATFISASNLDTHSWQAADVHNATQSAFAEIRDIVRDSSGYLVGETTYTNIDAAIMRYVNDESTRTFTVDGVVGSDGSAATGVVTFYLNESQVPVECGASSPSATINDVGNSSFDPVSVGTFDLDGVSGTNDYSTPTSEEDLEDLKILPLSIAITWRSPSGPVIRRRFYMIPRILTQTEIDGL